MGAKAMGEVAALALQKALYSQLSGDGALTALVGTAGVVDDVEEGCGFPYVTIGDIRSRDWSTQTKRGHEHQVTINVWSRAEGRSEVQKIMGAIDEALESGMPTLTDHVLVNLRPVFWHAMKSADGETYRGTVRVRAVTLAQ